MSEYYKDILKNHMNLFEKFLDFEQKVNEIANIILSSFMNKGKLILCGNGGGEIMKFCKYSLIVNSKSTARIQEAHIFLLHAICGIIDRKIINQNLN